MLVVSPDILEGLHGDLPHAGVGISRAGLDAAAVWHPVLEGVGPGRRLGGHGGVVVEAVPEDNQEQISKRVCVLVKLDRIRIISRL